MNNWAKQLFLIASACIFCATAEAALNKLGAMGDSLTDEYWEPGGVSTYASNWVSLVVTHRGIDFGQTASQAGVGSWGEPRNTGHKFNWARGGANSTTLLSQGQHTGLAAMVVSDGVSNAVLAIGSNDFNPSSSAYGNIYNNVWNAATIQTYVNQCVSNIETALITVKNAGGSVVLATVIDPGATPLAGFLFPNGTNRERVAAAVQSVNVGLKILAQKHQVPLMDWGGLARKILGANTNLQSNLKIGNVNINMRGLDSGSAPTNAFVNDGFHPNTVLQGIFANLVLQAFASSYGSPYSVFSEQEILNNSGISYGGSDTLQSQIGAYTDYITLPTPPKISSLKLVGANVELSLSTVSNQLYLVERIDTLAGGSWVTVASNLLATGETVGVTNAIPPGLPRRFYRVRQLP